MSDENRETCNENYDGLARIPSESLLGSTSGVNSNKDGGPGRGAAWERSQSALDLENHGQQEHARHCGRCAGKQAGNGTGGAVSEQSRVYWDLSKADEEPTNQMQGQNNTSASDVNTGSGGGKFKISLQTIHQKQEMNSSSAASANSSKSSLFSSSSSPKSTPKYSVTARMVRRMSAESASGSSTRNSTVTEVTSGTRTPPTVSDSPPRLTSSVTTSPPVTTTCSKFTSLNKPSLSVTLSHAVPILQENILRLQAPSLDEQKAGLKVMLEVILEAWATPAIGRDLAYGLCDVLRDDGGLEILVHNCESTATYEIQLHSARVLEQALTLKNREEVAKTGLQVMVSLAKRARDDVDLTRAATGILENLFKLSQDTCSILVRQGGLDSLLYSVRNSDVTTLRHCAVALANLAICGGNDNQSEMISHKAAEWLFPLAFSSDDNIRYYALLAVAALSANKEIEQPVLNSGTLQLVEPFVSQHDPTQFAHSDRAYVQGQSKEWLRRLVPLLLSRRPEAQSLAAFHFAMEAGIKQTQGQPQVLFSEIGAVGPLRHLACSTNKLASKFAAQALEMIGEEVPYQLSPQVPLWSVQDVANWLGQCGFTELVPRFTDLHVDGDLLLQIDSRDLAEDLGINNGITRKRFLRELDSLKRSTDYQSCDPTELNDWLKQLGQDYQQYAYQMLLRGADRRILRWISEAHLERDCCISNGIHRMRILEAAKRTLPVGSPLIPGDSLDGVEKPLDCFISYRRANGSQLASLLKVHLQIRGFSVFLDIERLKAGKFDDNLLNNVRNARHFVIVLTPGCLDRCVNDEECRDWVHKEIVAALEGGCNIVPVTEPCFEWPRPETLPADMRALCRFNGIRWIHDYQDACVDKLEKFLNREQIPRSTQLQRFSKQSFDSDIHGSGGPAMFRLGGSADLASTPCTPHGSGGEEQGQREERGKEGGRKGVTLDEIDTLKRELDMEKTQRGMEASLQDLCSTETEEKHYSDS